MILSYIFMKALTLRIHRKSIHTIGENNLELFIPPTFCPDRIFQWKNECGKRKYPIEGHPR
jgi:hypothetical protein